MAQKWDDKRLRKEFGQKEDHQYIGYNRALGKMIRSKEEFIHELEKGNYVGNEEGNILAEAAAKRNRKPYDDISPESKKKLRALRATARKDGTLSSLEGTIRFCKDVGINLNPNVPKDFEKLKKGDLVGDEKMVGRK